MALLNAIFLVFFIQTATAAYKGVVWGEKMRPEEAYIPEDYYSLDYASGPLQLVLQRKQRLDVPGEVGGVATDDEGAAWMFHRGNHKWEADSFDRDNKYLKKDLGPIAESVLVRWQLNDGQIKQEAGADQFYLPHGLTIDKSDNIWLTDVALHQVFRLGSNNFNTELILGTAFQPGNDSTHFCKPTDVDVTSNGIAFVSDGYCNKRVVKFDANGKYVGVINDPTLNIVHSITLIEDLDKVCVADRENYRVKCYNAGLRNNSHLGQPLSEIADERFGRIFAIDFAEGLIFVLSVPDDGATIDLFAVDPENDEVVPVISAPADVLPSDPQRHEQPHDMAIRSLGHRGVAVILGELDPHSVLSLLLRSVEY